MRGFREASATLRRYHHPFEVSHLPIHVVFPFELESERQEPATIMGADVASVGLVRALAEAAEVRMTAYAPAGWQRHASRRIAESPLAGAKVLDETQLPTAFPDGQPVIIQTLGPRLSRVLHLRWLCDSPSWPVVGLTYALSASSIFQHLTLAALGPLMPYDAVVCASRSGREVMAGMLGRLGESIGLRHAPRLPVIPLGVDTAKLKPLPKGLARSALNLPEDAVAFLFLGRLNPQYKADLLPLLEALARLQSDPRTLLLIAGSSAQPEAALAPLKLRCAELGLSDRVRWWVNVSREQRLELLSAADVFVSPADCLQEIFGLTLVEAMACGLPVIAADWNGYRDLVEVPACGRLIATHLATDLTAISKRAPLEDNWDLHWEIGQATAMDIDALAAAMAELAADAELRAAIGRAARARARSRFDWSRVVDRLCEQWEDLYRLAEQSEPPPPTSPYWYDHGEVFASHAVGRIGPATRIRRRASSTLGSVVLSPPPFLSRELLERLLDRLDRPSTVDSLLGDPVEVQRHVAYLLKHGQVELVE